MIVLRYIPVHLDMLEIMSGLRAMNAWHMEAKHTNKTIRLNHHGPWSTAKGACFWLSCMHECLAHQLGCSWQWTGYALKMSCSSADLMIATAKTQITPKTFGLRQTVHKSREQHKTPTQVVCLPSGPPDAWDPASQKQGRTSAHQAGAWCFNHSTLDAQAHQNVRPKHHTCIFLGNQARVFMTTIRKGFDQTTHAFKAWRARACKAWRARLRLCPHKSLSVIMFVSTSTAWARTQNQAWMFMATIRRVLTTTMLKHRQQGNYNAEAR